MLSPKDTRIIKIINNKLSKDTLVTKVSYLMKQLRTLKNVSKLRRHELLMAVIPNATRWGSLLACLLCYDAHFADLSNCDLDDDVLDMTPTTVEEYKSCWSI